MSETGQEDALGTGARALRAVKVLVGSNLETVTGETVARTARDEDAAAIVRMVNAHAAMFEALGTALNACVIERETRGDADATYFSPMEPVIEEIGRALAAARGEG
jgi:hypothetical protein